MHLILLQLLFRQMKNSLKQKNIKVHDTFIIPNGINLELYKKRVLEDKIKKKIVFFGRIHKKKGLEILINAINKLPDDYFQQILF